MTSEILSELKDLGFKDDRVQSVAKAEHQSPKAEHQPPKAEHQHQHTAFTTHAQSPHTTYRVQSCPEVPESGSSDGGQSVDGLLRAKIGDDDADKGSFEIQGQGLNVLGEVPQSKILDAMVSANQALAFLSEADEESDFHGSAWDQSAYEALPGRPL